MMLRWPADSAATISDQSALSGWLRPGRSQPDAGQKTSMTGMSAKADMGGAPAKVTTAVTS